MDPNENKFHKGNGSDGKHYWLTPPPLHLSRTPVHFPPGKREGREGMRKAHAYQIMIAIYEVTDIHPSEITCRSRKAEVVEARRIFIMASIEMHPEVSYRLLGMFAGGFDHATVLYHLKKHDDFFLHDKRYRAVYEKCINHIRATQSTTAA